MLQFYCHRVPSVMSTKWHVSRTWARPILWFVFFVSSYPFSLPCLLTHIVLRSNWWFDAGVNIIIWFKEAWSWRSGGFLSAFSFFLFLLQRTKIRCNGRKSHPCHFVEEVEISFFAVRGRGHTDRGDYSATLRWHQHGGHIAVMSCVIIEWRHS